MCSFRHCQYNKLIRGGAFRRGCGGGEGEKGSGGVEEGREGVEKVYMSVRVVCVHFDIVNTTS